MLAELPASFNPGECIGNLSRDVALVLAEFMDLPVFNIEECNDYEIDFKFVCVLLDDTNHKKEGFFISILVYTTNSDTWSAECLKIWKKRRCSRPNCSRLFRRLCCCESFDWLNHFIVESQNRGYFGMIKF